MMTRGVGAKVPNLLLSVAAEYAEARKCGRCLNIDNIGEGDSRIRNDPWYRIPGMQP